MESKPQNPEFRNSPENFHPITGNLYGPEQKISVLKASANIQAPLCLHWL